MDQSGNIRWTQKTAIREWANSQDLLRPQGPARQVLATGSGKTITAAVSARRLPAGGSW
ncbi:DEAD/DEAH box helicase family protein [Streptomyces lividans]